MTSTGHVTPLGDRLSGSLSPSHMVDVEKNGANDTIKPHDDAAKVMQAGPVSQTMFGEKREQYRSEEEYMYEQQKRSEGDHKFHRLGWKKLTICLLVEAIALGALSIPSAFATLGMLESTKQFDFHLMLWSIWALGIIEIIIYTLTSALIYTFVGTNVQSPALLSAGTSLSKVAFSIALPMIFISGSINTTVVVQYIHSHIFKNSVIRYINTTMGWVTWLGLVALITVIAWVITKAIPFFSILLGIMSALFILGFTFYFLALMWFLLIKEGKWNVMCSNTILSIMNASVFILGLVILVCRTYASIKDIIDQYNSRSVRGTFTCNPI
ncbi:probable neutral amino acid permease [Sporisorium scitamineum]|uniref:Probable neutral amino acid permease n=1 Tax=Sporisorium scitamineum TaxID=49012 RepID=A0A127ZCE1_9BASI|nr:probable neutral amino acid permease [Sporisorium scitamineum]